MGTTPLATPPTSLPHPPGTATATTGPATDAEQAVATLVAAFVADPVIRWFFPGADDYLAAFPEVLRLTSQGAAPAGTVDVLDGGAGAAIWHRPGTTSADDAVAEFVATRIPGPRHAMVFGFLEQMGVHHPDPATTWYLPFVGVDPTRQGQGHGSALLERGLDRADRDALPAYLEASSPRNRVLYERHGFEVTGEIQVADSPPMWPMLREPR